MHKKDMNTKGLVAVLFIATMLGCSQRTDRNIETNSDSIKTEVQHDTSSDVTPDSVLDSTFVDDELDELMKESFTVEYRQLVNGYKVKAAVKINHMYINQADITFTKNGKSFTLNTISFGDTLFNKGFWKTNENIIKIKKYRGQVVKANYHRTEVDWASTPDDTPFFFMDMDFDGVEELAVVQYQMGVKNHPEYDVYRIVEGKPFPIDYPPFIVEEYRLTNYPEFDYKKKTIDCPVPEGSWKYDGRIIYGVSKRKKDIIKVNGRRHYFNHIEEVRRIVFDE